LLKLHSIVIVYFPFCFYFNWFSIYRIYVALMYFYFIGGLQIFFDDDADDAAEWTLVCLQ